LKTTALKQTALKQISLIALGLFCASTSTISMAQSEEPQRYQVNLLVFERIGGGDFEENWRSDLRLKYPKQMVRLRNATEEDEAEPRLFHLHQNIDPEIKSIAQQMGRSANYRPLFLGAWNQVFVDKAEAPSLLIQGGGKFGRQFQLGGSIEVSLSRYLHLNTELWLISFVDGANRSLNEPWPTLPLPFEVAAGDESIPAGASIPLESQMLGNGGMEGIDPFANDPNFANDPFKQGGSGEFGVDPFSQEKQSSLQNTYSPLQQVTDRTNAVQDGFAVERTVTMRQHRRMRSSELHYVDHPMFGLVIKVDRVKDVKAAKSE
jgi:hypothetical protein